MDTYEAFFTLIYMIDIMIQKSDYNEEQWSWLRSESVRLSWL